MHFASDTTAPVHPAILKALHDANDRRAGSYGADVWCERARESLARVFNTDLDIWLVASGTSANALGLSLLCPPTSAVLCHADAHIERDERGAVEFFTGGGRLSLLPGEHGRIALDPLLQSLDANRPDSIHETPLAALSLSNLTESGAAYSEMDVLHRTGPARRAGLGVHLDGARFANALVHLGASPADLSWRAGVDVMSFGATKNGAMGCDAILLFGETRKKLHELKVRAKRAGHMPAKMRYLGAQMKAYLADDLWLDLAAAANAKAKRLAERLVNDLDVTLQGPVEGNEVFANLSPALTDALRAAGAQFHPWIDGSQRFVCAWSTTDAEVDALVDTALAASQMASLR